MTEALADIAAELYVLPLADFTSERNARAKDVSDRELAAAVRGLRKPSVAAWIVNVFARERAAHLGEALQLASELRDAQDGLDAAALSQLGRQRRMLTRRLAEEAAALARERGERVTGPTLEAVQGTISAAFFDPRAAAAITTGRLIRELSADGDASTDPAAAVAGGAPEQIAQAARPRDEVTARRELRRAEKAAHDAERARSLAERAHSAAVRRAAAEEQRARELEERRRALEEQLADTTRSLAEARAAIENARQEVEVRAEELDRARAGESRALDELRSLRR